MKLFSTGNGKQDRDKRSPELKGADRLAAEFDVRLAEIWMSVFECWPGDQALPEELSWFLRMAYLRGYEDSLSEPTPGALYRKLDASVPPQVRAACNDVRGGRR